MGLKDMRDVTDIRNINIKITDEQYDQIVIDYLRESIDTCYDSIDIDSKRLLSNDGEYSKIIQTDIDDCREMIIHLSAVIEYFGGKSYWRQ